MDDHAGKLRGLGCKFRGEFADEKNATVCYEAADEIERLRAFADSITDAFGPYPDLNGHPIVRAAYEVLRSDKGGSDE